MLRLRPETAPFQEYQGRPNDWFVERLGWEPWGAEDSPTGSPGQREWSDSIIRNRRTTIVTNNSSGKTTWCAHLALYFMECYPRAQVITTAPTWPQVDKLLWNKLRAAHITSKTKLSGKPLRGSCTWQLAPDWIALGISTDDEIQFQGFHVSTTLSGERGPLLVIVDEAAGLPPWAFNAIKGWAATGDVYIVYIGNANVNSGPFYDSHQSEIWDAFSLSAFDCPPSIINPEWIEECREDWGEESPQWEIRVLGQFSTKGSDWQMFPVWLLQHASENKPSENDEKHVGLDVARSTSGDHNVAALTIGNDVKAMERWQSDDTMKTTRNLLMLLDGWGITQDEAHHVHIDANGVGAGVFDRMAELGWGCDDVMFGEAPKGEWRETIGTKIKFANRKAELYWVAREMMKTGRLRVLPKFKQAWRQLQWPNYEIREGTDTILVEPKAKMKKRRGSPDSPDDAEAIIMTMSRAKSRERIWRL